MSTQKEAVLLINLGSPDSPSVKDVRRYLREFLSDERVIDVPWLVRQLVLNLFILPFRPKESAKAYQSVWTPEGSPLLVTSRKVHKLLSEKVTPPVFLAMRYGNPSIRDVLRQIVESGVTRLFTIPLYPHYAMSSYETVTALVQEELEKQAPSMENLFLAPFYQEPRYLSALYASAKPWLEKPFDHLLFSFHGIPERHIRKSDVTGKHCLSCESCCTIPSPAHAYCYKAHCLTTARELTRLAGLPDDKWSVSFQSRLGRDPWLKPYTDFVLEELPERGVKRLLVICPAFVSDCLETIEEIDERGREGFMHKGGEHFEMIPCMNDHAAWIDTLASYVRDFQEGKLTPFQPSNGTR